MNIPSIGHYGRKENTLVVHLGNLALYYSYKTIVAFWTPNTGLVVCENVWSTTTGKHLNLIDEGNKKARLSRDKFLAALNNATETAN